MDTQSFRLIGTTEIVTIPIQHADGQNVVCWETIEQVFPGVKCVSHGDVPISRYIKHFPHAVLNVALSSATDHVRVDSAVGVSRTIRNSAQTVSGTDAQADRPSDLSIEDNFVEGLRVSTALAEMPIDDISAHTLSAGFSSLPPTLPSQTETPSKVPLSFKQVVKLASKKANESDARVQQQELNTKMAYMILLQEASDAKQKEICELQKQALDQQEKMTQLALRHHLEVQQLQKASAAKLEEMEQLQKQALEQQEEMKRLAINHHEEIKQLQIQALGQLAVLQSRVQAVLTQTYELHEYPIPRLFIVLPQYPSGWDILEPFTEKYRLYFLCECGEHTKAVNSNSKISHEIHLAKHEGYEIARPTEFFEQYGPYILTILKMLKFSVSVASVAVPAVAHLINSDALDHVGKGLKHLKDCIEPGMDQVISKIEKDSADEELPAEDFADQMESKEALEGADLRKLETFLKAKDENKVLGNLYRTVTDEGHVKWVCVDHYRENYNRTAAEAFRRAVDAVGASFDENTGVVKVRLPSKVLANNFYSALEKARSVHELDISWGWECTRSDLEVLAAALENSRIPILRLDLRAFRPDFGTKLLSANAQYKALFRVAELPNMKTIHIVLPKKFSKHVSLLPKTPAHLHKLSFEMATEQLTGEELGLLAAILKTDSALTTLDLTGALSGDNGVHVLAAALKSNKTLTNLYLNDNNVKDNGAQALAKALETNSTLTTLYLESNKIGDNGAQALAESLETNSTLTILNLRDNNIKDNGAQALAVSLETNATLTTLYLDNNMIGDNGAQALAGALKANSALTSLNLGINTVGNKGAQALASLLTTNSTLTNLDLRANRIKDDGIKALAKALKANLTLTTLNLRSTSIGENGSDGAAALAEALKINATLTTLELQADSIGDDGIKALADALITNSTLTTLTLNNTYISVRGETRKYSIEGNGAQALADALKTNSTLTTLNLMGNNIQENVAQALADALKINRTLTTLTLEENYITDNGAKALAEALKTNSTVAITGLRDQR